MKALSAYPFSPLPQSRLPTPTLRPSPSFPPSTTRSNHRGFGLSIRAVSEGKEDEVQDVQQKGEGRGRGRGRGRGESSVFPSGMTIEDLEAMAGVGRSKRRKSRNKVKLDADPIAAKPEVKDWESMNLQEKVLQIYVGEKGILFWLNKLAYASIFVVIGGWIAFRFVGPSLGLYQLQSSLLEPTKAFGG